MSAATFEFTVLSYPPGDGAAVSLVQVRGEVDVTNAARLREALAEMATSGLIVDLSQVGYFDSAAFAALDQLLSEAPVAVAVSPGSVVRTAMTLLQMPFHDCLAAAYAALRLTRGGRVTAGAARRARHRTSVRPRRAGRSSFGRNSDG